MLWIICAILGTALLILSLGAFLNKKNGTVRMVAILAYLFAATYIIYIPPYFTSYDPVSALIGNLVNVLHVATVDVDVMDFYEVITAALGHGVLETVYILLLGIIHIALPTVSALTAVTVLFRCFSSLQMLLAGGNKRPLFVFSEVNERSLQLAKSLEKNKCEIAFAGSEESALGTENDGRKNYIYKDEAIAELLVHRKKNKQVYFFCISEDEDDSLNHCLQLIEKYSAEPADIQEDTHIFLFSRHRDFSVFIDSADKGSLDVQCVNEYEQLIYSLLDRYPLSKYASSRLHVLLHGMSPINIIALRAIAWCSQLGTFRTKISLVGLNIADQVAELKLACPGLFTDRYDIHFYDCCNNKEMADAVENHCADADYILVSDDTDNETMDAGILLRRMFYRQSEAFDRCPPIFCYIQSPSKHNILGKLSTAEANPKRKMPYNLIPFGSLESVYTYENLVEGDLEKLARNVHLAYEEIFSDGPIDVKSALKNYNVFEVNKRSNRANALHIRYKLNALGLDYTDDEKTAGVALKDFYTPEQMDILARAEHDRWMAFLESEGWTCATMAEVAAYRASDISKGRHNCPLLKMHPYISPYDGLKALSEELEGKDTTVYDLELIHRIPDILEDKWGAGGKKFKIIKLS